MINATSLQGRLCHYVLGPAGNVKSDKPFNENQHECQWCGGKAHCTFLLTVDEIDPEKKERLWICSNAKTCPTFTERKKEKTVAAPKRTIEWKEFCEKSKIGDLQHDVCFERIEKQSPEKLEYMKKFVDTPKGILMMQGEPGTGKTYCAMAMCELFTRKNRSCIFTTQRHMLNDWLDSFKWDKYCPYVDSLNTCSLLVIDDFGIGEPSKAFLEFIMDLINTRMQWSNRGTVVTTNLKDDKFSEFCGDALSNRFQTGQKFKFTGASRRKPNVL